MAAQLALGTVQFGLDYGIANQSGQTAPQEAADILRVCAAVGISLLDTAAAYGTSEAVLGGIWPTALPQARIVTKLRKTDGNWDPATELANSLARLSTERIYGYIYHDAEVYFRAPESLSVLQQAKADGRVTKIGFSVYHPAQIERLLDAVPSDSFDLVQLPLNLFDTRSLHLLPALRTRGIEVHVRSALLQGLPLLQPAQWHALFGYVPRQLLQFQEACVAAGLDPVHVLLAFAAATPGVDYVVAGVDCAAQLTHNLQYTSVLAQVAEKHDDWVQQYAVADEAVILPYLWNRNKYLEAQRAAKQP